MVKNEQNLHLKHPFGELAVDGVVKKFTVKKGVSINMARKTKGDTLTYQRGNKRVEHSPACSSRVHNLATHHEYLEQVRKPLEMHLMLDPSDASLCISIKWDDDKEVISYDSK